jgi:hypothetical protein
VLLLLLVSSVQAMNSSNFSLDWMTPLTGGGGGAVASNHYTIQNSVGQSAVSVCDSTNYATNMGFWQDFITILENWLPVSNKLRQMGAPRWVDDPNK